jgi:acetolactate decarboxylase
MQFIGDLRLLKTKELNGKADLRALIDQPHAYGIGMLTGLKGEVFIKDSKAYNGWFDGLEYRLDEITDENVAFLAYAHVSKWDPVDIPDDVVSFKELEAFIGEAAAVAGFIDEAVPIRLEAKAKGLRWFIANGEGNGAPDHLESFFRARVLGGLDDVSIDAVGLYSTKHRGIATNPFSDIHMHFMTKSGTGTGDPFVGHLDDDIMLAPGAVLYLPGR